MGLTLFNAFPFWVIFCHITLERSWAFVYIFVMYVATAITYRGPSLS